VQQVIDGLAPDPPSATPVYLCTWAASSIFSCDVLGPPGWLKTLNLVPLFA
jgi:hypothetical protein